MSGQSCICPDIHKICPDKKKKKKKKKKVDLTGIEPPSFVVISVCVNHWATATEHARARMHTKIDRT